MRRFDKWGSQGVHEGSSVSPCLPVSPPFAPQTWYLQSDLCSLPLLYPPAPPVVKNHHPKGAWDTDLLATASPSPAASFTFSLASMLGGRGRP